MAKKSVVNRNRDRNELYTRLKAKRDVLKQAVVDINSSDDEREAAVAALQKMPRDSSGTRRRNRCKLCGRPRAYNRLTGLCRLHMRIATINGMVPGMRKASW
jgi:small subunit ribosomal protein S14